MVESLVGVLEWIYVAILVIIILVVMTYLEDFWWNVISDIIIYGTAFFVHWHKDGFRMAVKKTMEDWHPLLMKIRDHWKHRRGKSYKKDRKQ